MPRRRSKRQRVPDTGRTLGKRSPKKRFILFCEGETEKCYFDALNRFFKDALIEVRSEPVGGVPKTVADKAIPAKTARRRGDSFEKNDEVWAVFDRDTHPAYEESIERCDSAGVGVARSNPCFELWLILHFDWYDQSCSNADVQRKLKLHIPEYHPVKNKRVDCSDLMASVEQAENRGEWQFDAREQERQGALGPPYTTVWRLTRAVREAAQKFRG